MNFKRNGVSRHGVLIVCFAVSTLAYREFEKWRCAHDEIVAKEDVTHKVRIPTKVAEGEQGEEDEYEHYRIEVRYDKSVNKNLSKSGKKMLKNTMKKLVAYFDSTISVKRASGPLLLDRACEKGLYFPPRPGSDVKQCAYKCEPTMCGSISTIPKAHLKRCIQCKDGTTSNCKTKFTDGTGVYADFILYVSAVTVDDCPQNEESESTLLAFASVCQTEETLDRPIAGYANFCPFAVESIKDEEHLLAVAKHEVLHAMVFSSSLFPFYRDEHGNPRTPRDNNGYPPLENGQYTASEDTVRSVEYVDWQTRTGPVPHTVSMLVTPKVTKEARDHFSCSKLEGLELENGGGSGTASSHWEQRLLGSEGMTGVVTGSPVFSRMSLAILEDSGWYKVDYSMAEALLWGRDSGCNFAADSCGGYIESQLDQQKSISPFCNSLKDPTVRCNFERTAGSYCNLAEYKKSLPPEYQYFNGGADFDSSTVDVSKVGGSSSVSDYCPYYSEYSNLVCGNPDNSPGEGIDNILAETYAPGSMCFDTINRWTVQEIGSPSYYYIDDPGYGCYQHVCSDQEITVSVLGQKYTCSSEGEELEIVVTHNDFIYQGTIVCPQYMSMCYE